MFVSTVKAEARVVARVGLSRTSKPKTSTEGKTALEARVNTFE